MTNHPIYAFILMPFDPKFNDVYNIGIKEAASQVGVIAERLDEQIFIEGMLDRIYRQIDAADIIIADMSDKNPNVFYEVGYAHAKDKLCILQTTDAKDIPFDLKHRRHIVYNGSISYLRDELAKNLSWAKTEIENARKSQIRVEFRSPLGDLTTNEWAAEASIKFQVDLFNDSNKTSSEISTIYFYAGKFWSVKQGDKECPSTGSDIEGYKYRYFLTPPVTKLAGESWAQLQFTATRIVANKSLGGELQNSYPITGYIILRFITSSGTFDYKYYVNISVSEILF